MKLAIGSDHGGFELKEYLKKYLDKEGVEYKDFGTFSKGRCDYPDFAKEVGAKVAYGDFERGLLICTTGVGMSITANKYYGARAALCHNVDGAKFSRLHNDANILCLGAKYVRKRLAKKILKTFLETEFEGGRHERRLKKIQSIEDKVL